MALIHNSIKTVIIVTILTLGTGIVIGTTMNVEALSSPSIPAWIKNTAKWWAEGQVSDTEFINALQWLVEKKILVIPSNKESVSSNTIQMGKPVSIDGISYTITSVQVSKSFPGGGFLEQPQGEYMMVIMDVKNVSKESKNELSTSDFVIVDSEDRKFNALKYMSLLRGETWGMLQPGLGGQRAVVFFMPFDSNLEYELLIKNNMVRLDTITHV